ncbi:MAG: aldehyde dehydrogenase family protein [Patescibacteria group bacterium]
MAETMHTHGHIIDDVEILDGDVLERRNPANNDEVVALSHDGTPAIMDAAVESSQKAFERWSETTPSLRGEVLFHAAVLLNTPAWRTRFVEAMVQEIGKTAGGANGEVTKTVNILRYMSGLPTHTRDDVYNGDQPNVLMYGRSEPVGPAAIITPFNFPLAVTVWKAAAALAAGCTVVIKPSPHAPMTSALIMELFREAMLRVPALKDTSTGKLAIPGVINMVHGGPDIVSALVRNQLIQAVSMTGSTQAGEAILKMAMLDRDPMLDPGHFLAERGGDNAILVLADADLDMAVSAAVTGFAIGEGQRCTATKRILVDELVADRFLAMFLEKVRALKVGPGSDPKSDVGPLVTPEAVERVLASIQQSLKNGMELLAGGSRLTESSVWAQGNFIEPTILAGDPKNRDHLALREEIFGPVAGFARVRGFEEGIAAVNDNAHRHVAGVFTENPRRAAEFIRRANAGMVHGNNSTLGGDVQAPFGGTGGATSFGPQEMGPDAMRVFQRHKTVGWNYGNSVLGGRAR